MSAREAMDLAWEALGWFVVVVLSIAMIAILVGTIIGMITSSEPKPAVSRRPREQRCTYEDCAFTLHGGGELVHHRDGSHTFGLGPA